MKSVDEYCKILGIDSTATPEDLKKAYRNLVKKWHPDRFRNKSHLQSDAQDRLQEINEAYRELQPFLANLQKNRSNRPKEPAPAATRRRYSPNLKKPQRPAAKPKPSVKRHVLAWRKTLDSIERTISLNIKDPWIIVPIVAILVLAVILDWFF